MTPPKISPDTIRLKDILQAISDIESFATTHEYDRKTLFATAYAIAIIGQACGKLSPELREAHHDIPWKEIIGMRHRIIHGYGQINIERLKAVVEQHIPSFKQAVEQIAREIPR